MVAFDGFGLLPLVVCVVGAPVTAVMFDSVARREGPGRTKSSEERPSRLRHGFGTYHNHFSHAGFRVAL